MGQLSELENHVRRMQRRREYLSRLFDMNERLVRKYLKQGMISWHIGGAKVKIHRDREGHDLGTMFKGLLDLYRKYGVKFWLILWSL